MTNLSNWMMLGVLPIAVGLSGCGGGGGSTGGNSAVPEPQPETEARSLISVTFPAIDMAKGVRAVSGELLGFVVIDGNDRVPLSLDDGEATAQFDLPVGQYGIHVLFEYFDEARSTTWTLAESQVQAVEIILGPNPALLFEATLYNYGFDDDGDGINNLTELENGTDPGTPDVFEPVGGVVDAHGNPLSVVDLNDPVTIRVAGLAGNTPYTLRVVDAAGVEHNPPGGFRATTDEAGNLYDLTMVHNLDMNDVLPGALAQTGSHHVQLLNDAGEVVHNIEFIVENASRVVCIDGDDVPRASFLPSETVFARVETGGGGLADGGYNLYVIPDLNAVFNDGDFLAGTLLNVDVVEGVGALSLGNYTSGAFDVIVDVNGNGVFDQGVDLISRHRRLHACFAIQNPEAQQAITAQLCADRNGNFRNVFDPNTGHAEIRDMFAYGAADVRSLVQTSAAVGKYVVLHKDVWSGGEVLEDVTTNVERNPAQAFSMRDAPWLVWPRPAMQNECYDVVMDVNNNGVFDLGIDIVDNTDTTGNPTCGCRVAIGACQDDVVITSVADGDTLNSSTVVLEGTVAGATTGSAFVEISAGPQANTVNITAQGETFSAEIPLFIGRNLVTTSFFYDGGDACSRTLALTSAPVDTLRELLRIQLTWDGDSDMDLHLVRPGGVYKQGGGGDDDCNYSNCIVDSGGGDANTIDWGLVGVESDDPKLDVDCVSCGNGIENIVMNEINEDGTYSVYVDAFADQETDVTVTVFIGGAQVGQVNCGDMAADTATDSCRVGTVEWSGGSEGSGIFRPDGTKAADFSDASGG